MDLPRLCEASGVGAEISGERLPIWADSRSWQCDPVALALHGGEDFELLFVVPARKTKHLESAYPDKLPVLSRIGRLRLEPGVVWSPCPGTVPQPLMAAGFDHFSG